MRIGERGTRVAVASSCLLAILVFLSSVALGEAVCSDSFDNAGSGWDVGTSDVGTTEYRNGIFQIRMARPDELLWSWSPCGSVPDSFIIAATGRTHPGIDAASWGIVWGVGDENLLAFLITPTGLTTAVSMREGKWQRPPIAWKESTAIDRGDGVQNRLRVTVDGSSVTVRINNLDVGHFETGEFPDLGAELLEGADSSAPGPVSLADGDGWRVGVIASSFEMTPVKLNFDSFEVFALP